MVDDAPSNLHILNSMLSQEAYEISAATSASQALSIARDLLPDLILLDIVMPDSDGFEVCRKLKASSETRDIPVIFITAIKTGSDDIVRGFRLGAADYVTKPFNPPELLARVRTHLALKRAYNRLEMQAEALRKSEMRYRAVIEDQTELICRFRPDGVLTFVNDACCRYFGKTEDEMVGMNFLSLISKKDREKVKVNLASMSQEKPVITSEHQVADREGDICWQQWTGRAIFDDSGRITEFQSVGRDITDRVQAEEAYHSLVDHSLQGLAILQNHQGYVFANSMMAEITGYTIEELLVLTPDEIKTMIHPEDRERIWTQFQEHLAGNSVPRRYQARVIRKDGKIRWLEVSAVLTRYMGKPAIQWTFIDATRLVKLETLLGERRSFGNLIGRSTPMQRVYTLIEQFADTDSTVLITGETGTGKELVMEAIHSGSARSDCPLIKVNCAALAENILESELFGHVKGAFTGADKDKAGRFQMAQGGVIFLDEIGDIPLSLQAKLLRVLEYKEFEQVGDAGTVQADVRIIAATNIDLEERVRQGAFRKDVYYRLSVFTIHLPPLRKRTVDIPFLAKYFISAGVRGSDKNFVCISDEVLDIFRRYSWPGNVRELKNALEYACAICPGGKIGKTHLPPKFSSVIEKEISGAGECSSFSEKDAILNALKRTKWHKTKAARLLGISRSTFYRKLKEYGISED